MGNVPHIGQKTEKKSFWAWAKCRTTRERYAPGTKKYRHKFDLLFGAGKFRRLRYYVGPNGEKRKTVEIEV